MLPSGGYETHVFLILRIVCAHYCLPITPVCIVSRGGKDVIRALVTLSCRASQSFVLRNRVILHFESDMIIPDIQSLR